VRHITAIKYRAVSKCYSPEEAQTKVERRRELHPDHEYTILVNTAAYSRKYIVARIEHVNVGVPSADDLGLPPAPQPPSPRFLQNQQAWDDYRHEAAKRDSVLAAAFAPIEKRLTVFD
jgi:hypothetical protein